MEEIFKKLGSTIRAASGLAAKDINFYKNIDAAVRAKSDEYSGELLEMINEVMSTSGSDSKVDKDTIKDSWSVLSNLVDNYLERADIAFDQLKRGQSQNEETSQVTYLDDSTSINNSHGLQIEKPQAHFKTKVDNTESHPFKPLLTTKPHAINSLEEVSELQEDSTGMSYYQHPYEYEILNQEYNEGILNKSEPQKFQDWESTDCIWVDNITALNEMLTELRKADSIAIDLEHHDYRTYYGIVSLMQISSRDQDWLIDTIALRDDLQVLNEIFTNPQVTKVLHGAFMDIIWLQRDLGLYVVSLFDTYHASKSLGFPKHSLAYLLERFANFKTSKKYQLADWRIRPLTKQMKLYARADTHFLLYIFDVLKNMLIDANKLTQVLHDSRKVALRRFEYSKFKPENSSNNSLVFTNYDQNDSWKKILYQYNIPTSQAKLVESLYNWRDETARLHDESPRYVMPNQLLATIASLCPTTTEDLLSIPNTSSISITELVRKNSKILADLIKMSLKLSETEDMNLFDRALLHRVDGTSDDDHSEVITVDKAEKYYGFFKKAESESFRDFKDDVHFNVENSQLFSSSMLHGNPLPERSELIESKLNQIVCVSPIEEEIGSDDNANDDKLLQYSEPATQVTAAASTMFDKSDDIVVLKKRTFQKKRRDTTHKNKTENEQTQEFDYSKAEKVIQPHNRREKGKKRKEREDFNPYAKVSEGPKPATNREISQHGKSASFVDKKRRK